MSFLVNFKYIIIKNKKIQFVYGHGIKKGPKTPISGAGINGGF